MAPKLVIVGGGVAGAILASNKKLAAHFDVTLVDAKEFHEVPYSMVRSPMDAAFAASASWAHGEYTAARVVRGKAAGLDPAAKTLSLEDGSNLPYDYLVLATGSRYDGISKDLGGGTKPERLAALAAVGRQIADAKSILVLGSGPLAVEMVAEILAYHPGKKLTLLTRSKRLLAHQDQAAADIAEAFLDKRGVRLLFADTLTETPRAVTATEPRAYATTRGQSIEADLVLPLIGGLPNTNFLPASLLDANGFVPVEPTLRVKSAAPNAAAIFALGDINTLLGPGKKTGYAARTQAELLVNSLLALAKNPAAKLAAYPEQMRVGIVTLGPAHGVFSAPGCCGRWNCGPTGMMPTFKSKDLLVGMVRGALGMPAAPKAGAPGAPSRH